MADRRDRSSCPERRCGMKPIDLHPADLGTIKAVTARFFDVRLIEMTSDRRARRFARPRQVAMYLATRLTKHSLPLIGRNFGGRDHTTVIHARDNIERLMVQNWDLRKDVEYLEAQLKQLSGIEHKQIIQEIDDALLMLRRRLIAEIPGTPPAALRQRLCSLTGRPFGPQTAPAHQAHGSSIDTARLEAMRSAGR
ncbi:MAG: hypothetical protein HQL35_04810 [Alphaproteobacteria bacterium]|nr:hypothetical protein [Alphaproteobacteria bacterium]